MIQMHPIDDHKISLSKLKRATSYDMLILDKNVIMY